MHIAIQSKGPNITAGFKIFCYFIRSRKIELGIHNIHHIRMNTWSVITAGLTRKVVVIGWTTFKDQVVGNVPVSVEILKWAALPASSR